MIFFHEFKSSLTEYPSACSPEAPGEKLQYFQILNANGEALELFEHNIYQDDNDWFRFTTNQLKDSQFWYWAKTNPDDEYGYIAAKIGM